MFHYLPSRASDLFRRYREEEDTEAEAEEAGEEGEEGDDEEEGRREEEQGEGKGRRYCTVGNNEIKHALDLTGDR